MNNGKYCEIISFVLLIVVGFFNLLYVAGQSGQIALINWINGTWHFPPRPLLLINGSIFDPTTCSGMSTVTLEHADYDLTFFEHNGQLVVRDKQNSNPNEMVLQVSYFSLGFHERGLDVQETYRRELRINYVSFFAR